MKTFVTAFNKKLYASLEARNIHPSFSVYENVTLEIYRTGERKLEDVKSALGPRSWQSLLQGMEKNNPEGHCTRMLGFGYHLSAFMIAPVDLTPSQKEQVCETGMLTNLIVAVYDRFLDVNKGRNPLPGWLLLLCRYKGGRLAASMLQAFLPGKSRAITSLVSLYFKKFDSLACGRKQNRGKKKVYDTINSMYRAEKLFGKKNTAFNKFWLRKSALPFVVMGLPALLAAGPGSNISSLALMRRGYEVGEIFGLVDDVADLVDDQLAQQPNFVDHLLSGNGEIQQVIDDITARVTSLLLSVFTKDSNFYLGDKTNFDTLNWIPVVCAIGWLGGPKYYQSIIPAAVKAN